VSAHDVAGGCCAAGFQSDLCPLWLIRGRNVPAEAMSALPPKADNEQTCRHVRFVPKADSCSAKDSLSAIIRDGYYEPAEVVIGELLRKSACTDASFVVD
jgi:hypothetical protein